MVELRCGVCCMPFSYELFSTFPITNSFTNNLILRCYSCNFSLKFSLIYFAARIPLDEIPIAMIHFEPDHDIQNILRYRLEMGDELNIPFSLGNIVKKKEFIIILKVMGWVGLYLPQL